MSLDITNVEPEELWRPSEERKTNTRMWEFMQRMAERHGTPTDDYAALHSFSVENPDVFWSELIDFYDLQFKGDLEPANLDTGFETYGWFPNVRLNYAENLLAKGADNGIAFISTLENGFETSVSYSQLRSQVAKFQNTIQGEFVEGDVLACYMPNILQTPVAMLAATGLGGVFTSTSCDFGVEGVVDRFSQSKPTILVAAEGYFYGGKYFDCMGKISEVVSMVSSIKRVFIVQMRDSAPKIDNIDKAEHWPEMVDAQGTPRFVSRAFADPLYIMYSSGTIGKPKCIVHSVGGTLLKNVQELGLHSDLSPDKRIFFFTTCGWMMWNWLMSSLYFGSTVILFDGSPGYPSMIDYLSMIDRLKINVFGTSPKFLRSLQDSKPDLSSLKLDSLETIHSTGAPLMPEQYDYVYQHIKQDVLLANIAGGTDLMGGFYLGNPVQPVYRGELQCAPLGIDSTCVDENGCKIIDQEGELACMQSFPSRPLYFLNDPNCERLNSAYFVRFPGIWHHGDFIKVTKRGGALFFGRSDATLNPGGVRIGTSEIYRQTESLGFLEDTVCVGKKSEGDVDVVLFVKLKPTETLTEERIKQIKYLIRTKNTPRHVPKSVIQVADIPYTRSGKKIEGVIANIINGRSVTNIEAIINPESLDEYYTYNN